MQKPEKQRNASTGEKVMIFAFSTMMHCVVFIVCVLNLNTTQISLSGRISILD